MISILCDFLQFSAEKLASSLKTNVIIQFLKESSSLHGYLNTMRHTFRQIIRRNYFQYHFKIMTPVSGSVENIIFANWKSKWSPHFRRKSVMLVLPLHSCMNRDSNRDKFIISVLMTSHKKHLKKNLDNENKIVKSFRKTFGGAMDPRHQLTTNWAYDNLQFSSSSTREWWWGAHLERPNLSTRVAVHTRRRRDYATSPIL
jgi:hypothetical protein